MHLPRIQIEVINHKDHRYPTCGDWFERDGVLHIRVSKLSNWRYEFLIAVHELIEVMLCRHDGVTEKQVDRFDIAYEKRRKKGDDSEPGDSPRAPYVKHHCLATGFERILAALLGVKWAVYERELYRLP